MKANLEEIIDHLATIKLHLVRSEKAKLSEATGNKSHSIVREHHVTISGVEQRMVRLTFLY